MPFSRLLGNPEAKLLLTKLAKQERRSHVLLLSGPKGVGKKSFALAFCELLLGAKHAVKIGAGIHPDVIGLKPEGKTSAHSVATIEQMIADASLSPFEAQKKVYVIEQADRMLPYGSNALLKILEEPPPDVSFILLTSRQERMLPTILSRCSYVPFYPIAEDVLVKGITERSIPEDKAREIALLAEGSFSRALELSAAKDNPVKVHFRDILKHFFLTGSSLALTESLDHLDKLIEKQSSEEGASGEIAETLLEDCFYWLRDLHYKKTDPDCRNLFYGTSVSELEAQLKKQLPSLESGLIFIEEARIGLQRSIKPKVVFERLFSTLRKADW